MNLLRLHFRSDDKKKKEKGAQRLVWQVEDFSDSVQLAVNNRVIHCCQYGKGHKRDLKCKKPCEDGEHDYTVKRRFHIQKIKKVDCPAKVFYPLYYKI
ncbi:hypothetical protein HHUSO_G5136 [Huso huso]|uniref:Uncharacterized protein n=1 Tax=Huso huso TaxID=61971 RepID=A0ABR1A0F6_HUSHU